MRDFHIRLIIASLLLSASSSLFATPTKAGPTSASKNQPERDACSLFSSKEIEAIQGAGLATKTPSQKNENGLSTSQCYFLFDTSDNSILLSVIRRDKKASSRNPTELWDETFHREKEERKEKERDEKEERDIPMPKKLRDLGDEAFWVPQHFGGILHVRKGDVYFMISVGGAGDETSQIKKARKLAEIASKRL